MTVSLNCLVYFQPLGDISSVVLHTLSATSGGRLLFLGKILPTNNNICVIDECIFVKIFGLSASFIPLLYQNNLIKIVKTAYIFFEMD